MQMIDAGRTLLAAGLDWDVSTVAGFRPQQIGRRAKGYKATHYVEHVPKLQTPDRLYGFGSPPSLPKAEKRPVLSLASLVARARTDNFAFLAPLERGAMAFVGVLGGHPVPGNDIVGDEDSVLSAVQSFVRSNGIMHVYYAELLGRPELVVDGSSLVPLEFTLSDADVQHARIQRVPGQTDARAVMIAAGIVGLAGIGGFAWHKHEEAVAAAEAAAQPSPQQIYIAARGAAFATLPKFSANGLGLRMADIMLPEPPEHAGWRLQKVECTIAPKPGQLPPGQPFGPSCIESWEPKASDATYAGFAIGWTQGTPRYDSSLNLITTAQAVSTVSLTPLSPVIPYPKAQEYLRQDGTFFQLVHPLGFKIDIGAWALIGSPATPIVAGMIDQTTWSANGPVDLMRTFLTALPPSMAISSLSVTVPQPSPNSKNPIPSFDAKGTLYVTAQ